jgi:transcriptional regulator GlxA family with amidase domain
MQSNTCRTVPVPVKDIAVLALPGSYLSSIGALVDGFALVARQVLGQFSPPYRQPMRTKVRLISPAGERVLLACGRELGCEGDMQEPTLYSVVYVPAFLGYSEEALGTVLDHAGPIVEWLRWQRAHGALLAASGTAVLLLARTGLLDQGRAAVIKLLAPLCRRRFPHVRLETRATLVEHEGIHTCSAPADEWPLVARLVEQAVSPHSASWLASATGMQTKRSDQPLTSEDPLVATAQFWLAQRFAQDFKISELADALAVSHATLLRRFSRSLGVTPRDYAQRLRVEAGKRLLQSTPGSIEQIAMTVGYSDVRAFRALFQEHTGMSPMAYRKQARTRVRGDQ